MLLLTAECLLKTLTVDWYLNSKRGRFCFCFCKTQRSTVLSSASYWSVLTGSIIAGFFSDCWLVPSCTRTHTLTHTEIPSCDLGENDQLALATVLHLHPEPSLAAPPLTFVFCRPVVASRLLSSSCPSPSLTSWAAGCDLSAS